MENKKWVEIFTIYDLVQANAIEALLRERDIPVSVHHYDGSHIFAVYSPTVGKGEIRVPEEYVDEAKRIIADFKKEQSKP